MSNQTKKEFLELYENAREGKVDLLKLSPQTLSMMCSLAEEEIRIKERKIEDLKVKLSK